MHFLFFLFLPYSIFFLSLSLSSSFSRCSEINNQQFDEKESITICSNMGCGFDDCRAIQPRVCGCRGSNRKRRNDFEESGKSGACVCPSAPIDRSDNSKDGSEEDSPSISGPPGQIGSNKDNAARFDESLIPIIAGAAGGCICCVILAFVVGRRRGRLETSASIVEGNPSASPQDTVYGEPKMQSSRSDRSSDTFNTHQGYAQQPSERSSAHSQYVTVQHLRGEKEPIVQAYGAVSASVGAYVPNQPEGLDPNYIPMHGYS